jgi:hypothetical protein
MVAASSYQARLDVLQNGNGRTSSKVCIRASCASRIPISADDEHATTSTNVSKKAMPVLWGMRKVTSEHVTNHAVLDTDRATRTGFARRRLLPPLHNTGS